jgi:hypothetical protein
MIHSPPWCHQSPSTMARRGCSLSPIHEHGEATPSPLHLHPSRFLLHLHRRCHPPLMGARPDTNLPCRGSHGSSSRPGAARRPMTLSSSSRGSRLPRGPWPWRSMTRRKKRRHSRRGTRWEARARCSRVCPRRSGPPQSPAGSTSPSTPTG